VSNSARFGTPRSMMLTPSARSPRAPNTNHSIGLALSASAETHSVVALPMADFSLIGRKRTFV
jgi:hypothetical protein